MSITVIIPVADAPALNAALEELGHGPSNVDIELRLKPGSGAATHMAAHCWPHDAFLADVESLMPDFPGMEVVTEFVETDEEGNTRKAHGVLFDKVTKAKGYEKIRKDEAI